MSERFMKFVVSIIILETGLCTTYSGRHIYTQLFRSGTFAGANFEESRSGESRADLIHKMQIGLKELRESKYWIRLICNAHLVQGQKETLDFILNEANVLLNIIAKSVATAKVNSVHDSIR